MLGLGAVKSGENLRTMHVLHDSMNATCHRAPRQAERAAGSVAAWFKASRVLHPPPDESEKRAATSRQRRGAIGTGRSMRVQTCCDLSIKPAKNFCLEVTPRTEKPPARPGGR